MSQKQLIDTFLELISDLSLVNMKSLNSQTRKVNITSDENRCF